MRVFLFFSDFANVSNRPFFFAALGLVGKLFIIFSVPAAALNVKCGVRIFAVCLQVGRKAWHWVLYNLGMWEVMIMTLSTPHERIR